MDLGPYVEGLRQQVMVSAEAGGEEVRALAARLLAPLDSAARLTLLEALSAAAAEITREMAPGSVDVRLRGQEPSFVVTLPRPARDDEADEQPDDPRSAPVKDDGDDGGTARISLRLPESLKWRVEDAATCEGLSVNAWICRALGAAVDPGTLSRRRRSQGPQHYTGWAR